MGKTNLLDAIYYLSFCKSHLNPVDNQIIKHDADFFMIQGEYVFGEQVENISCGVKRRRKKQFMRNKKEYDRLAEHIGFVPLVLVSPADNSLIDDGSEERRRFMDIVISQYDRKYLDNLMIYNSLLQNRNALLKTLEKIDDTMLEILEEKMCAVAEQIFECRQKFIESFVPVFKEFYNKISGNPTCHCGLDPQSPENTNDSDFRQNDTRQKEDVDLHYISHLQQDTKLDVQFLQTRERDKILGYTTHGIHKDDLKMTLQEFPLKNTGSQGQNKTYVTAMKLAQFVFLKNVSRKTPILLLDDLFDKLDTERVTKIVELISNDDFGQIFITDTNREHLNEILSKTQIESKIFYISEGRVE
jgi:DNA replication and repair protein RecF